MATLGSSLAIALLGATALSASAVAAETTGRRATRAPQIDYVNAIPLPLPLNPASPASPAGGAGDGPALGPSGFEPE